MLITSFDAPGSGCPRIRIPGGFVSDSLLANFPGSLVSVEAAKMRPCRQQCRSYDSG